MNKYIYLYLFILFIGCSLALEYKTSAPKFYNEKSRSTLVISSTGCTALQYYVVFQGKGTVDNIKCTQGGISAFTWSLAKNITSPSSNLVYELTFTATFLQHNAILKISVVSAGVETAYSLTQSPIVCLGIHPFFNVNHKPIMNLKEKELEMELATDNKQFYQSNLSFLTCKVSDGALTYSTCTIAQDEYSPDIFILRVPITLDLYKKEQVSVSVSHLNSIVLVQFDNVDTPFKVSSDLLMPTTVSYPSDSSIQNDYLTSKSSSVVLSTTSKDANTGVLLAVRGGQVISAFRASLATLDSKTLHLFINYDLTAVGDQFIKVYYKTLESNQVVLKSTDIKINLALPTPIVMSALTADAVFDLLDTVNLPILKLRATGVSITDPINVATWSQSFKVPFPFGISKLGGSQYLYKYSLDQFYPFTSNTGQSVSIENGRYRKDIQFNVPVNATYNAAYDKTPPTFYFKTKRTFGQFITYRFFVGDVFSVYTVLCLNTNQLFSGIESEAYILGLEREITIDLSKLVLPSSRLLLQVIDHNGNVNTPPLDSIYFDENLNSPFDLFSEKIYLKDIVNFEFKSNLFESSIKSLKNSLFFNLVNGDQSLIPIIQVLNDKTNEYSSFSGSFDQVFQKYRIDFDIPPKSSSEILDYKLLLPSSLFSFKSLQSYFGDAAIIKISNTDIDNYPPMFSQITFIGGSNEQTITTATKTLGWLFTINDRPSGFKYGNITVISNLNPKPKVYTINLDKKESGNMISSVYKVSFDVTPTTPSQIYMISSVVLVDSNGATSSYPPNRNEFSPFHELGGYSHSITVTTPRVYLSGKPIIRYFNVVQNVRTITIKFNTSDPSSPIATEHVPIIYVTGRLGKTQTITPNYLGAAAGIYSYETTFALDPVIAYFDSMISVYGIYDTDLNINGYSPLDLKAAGFQYIIPRKTGAYEPIVDSFTSISQNGGLLTIYGKRFQESSANIDGKTLYPLHVSANVIVYDFPPTLVQQTVTIRSPVYNLVTNIIIKPNIIVYPTTNIIYVDMNSICQTSCGSFVSPYPSLSLALKNTLKRTTIILKDGVYKGEDNMNLLINSSQPYTDIRSMNSTSKVVFDCEGYSQLFNVKGSKSFTLTNIVIDNCTSNLGGALLFENSIVTLDNVKLLNNKANSGGAIYLVNSELKLVNSMLRGNKAITSGAAIYSHLSTVEIKGYFTTFLDNSNFNPALDAGASGKPRDILCQNSTLKIDDDVYLNDVNVRCKGCNNLYSRRDVCQTNLLEITPPTPPITNRDATTLATTTTTGNDVCGDKVCSSTESCLSCPNDCSCYVDGMIQQTFQPGCSPTYFIPDNSFESGTPPTPVKPCIPLLSTTLPIVKVENPTNYINTNIKNVVIRLFGYVSVESSKEVSFNFQGTNYGLIFKVNGQQQFYFNQITSFNEIKSLYLIDRHVHFIEIILFTTMDDSKRLFTLAPFEDTTTKLFYSNLICGDGILNEREQIQETSTNPDILNYYCLSDLDYPIYKDQPECGDHICNEDPDKCFSDCYIEYTPVCPATQVIEGAISPGFSVGDDTLGSLISNQFIWRLAGSEHLSFGINIVNGEEGMAPIFQFDYCQDAATNVLEDAYRGKLYHIPVEFNAKAVPECSFDTNTESFKSVKDLASSETLKMLFDAEATLNVNGVFYKGGFTASFSDEKSIKNAYKISSSNSQRIFRTDLLCKSTYVELDTNRVSFHPSLLDKFAKVQTAKDMLKIIETHGTHFYKKSYLGGKLTQIAVTDEANIDESTEYAYTESIRSSLSTSLSGPAFSVKVGASGSYDRNEDIETQNEINDKTTYSKIITYGGLPAAFSLAQDGVSSPGFSEWAQSVDMLPVPIDYQLYQIGNLINEKWVNQYGVNIKQSWDKAEEMFYASQLTSKKEFIDNIDYTLVFNMLNNNQTNYDPFSSNPTLSITYYTDKDDIEGTTLEIPIIASYTDRFGNKVNTVFSNVPDHGNITHSSVQLGFFGVRNWGPNRKLGLPYLSIQHSPNRNMLYPIRFDFKAPDFINSFKKPIIKIILSDNSFPIEYNKNPKIISWKQSLGVVLDQNGIISNSPKYYGISAFESKWSNNANPAIYLKAPLPQVDRDDDTTVDGVQFWGRDYKNDMLEVDETLMKIVVCYPDIHQYNCKDRVQFSFEGQSDNHHTFEKLLVQKPSNYNPTEWYETTVWHNFDVVLPTGEKPNNFSVSHPIDNIGLGTRINWIKVLYPQPNSWKFDVTAYHIKENQKENHMDEWLTSEVGKESQLYELTEVAKIPNQLFYYFNYNFRAPTYQCPHGWEYPYFHNLFNSTEEIGRTKFTDRTGTYTYYQENQLGYNPTLPLYK